jgi:hypothetical protein
VSYQTLETYQFGEGAHYPVHVDFDGHDFHSNGISHDDYARMQTQRHKLNAYRHGASPDWAFNDSKLRAVIVGCMEARAQNGTEKINRTGTDAERMERAQKKIAEKHSGLEERINKLCKLYVTAKRAGDAALTKHFAQKVEETDTVLRLLDNPAKFYAGVAYHYWRCGLNSVETAQQLHIKPPHVRQILWRMGKVAGQLGYGPPKHMCPSTYTRNVRRKKKMTTEELLAVAKVIIEKHRRQKIAATLQGRPRPKAVRQKISASRQGYVMSAAQKQQLSQSAIAAAARQGTNLIPYADRLPLVVRMYHAGAKKTEIAAALGWRRSKNGNQNGTGMVKRLMIKAGLRKP